MSPWTTSVVLYIDQRGGGSVVVLFKGDAEIRADALSGLLHPDAKWTIREAVLRGGAQRSCTIASPDAAWLESAGILPSVSPPMFRPIVSRSSMTARTRARSTVIRERYNLATCSPSCAIRIP
jgi:hypothetical protein